MEENTKKKLKAAIIFDEELESWIIYVDAKGETIPVGNTINEDLGLFGLIEFDSKERAKEWIDKEGKFEYSEEFENELNECASIDEY